jgi:tripartite-type tricarboxylate transporter receptor subunit TctC
MNQENKMKNSIQVRPHAVMLGLASLAAVALASPAAAEWYPEKPVELVIMAGEGGGADKMARFFKQIIEDEDLSPVPFEPVNMPGDSGAEALMHLKKNKGNPHVVMVTLNSFYTTPLSRPNLKIDILKYTPVARMAEDTFLLWVNKESKINSLEEFVKAAQAKGSAWTMAGTGTASEDNLLTDFLNDAYGLKMKYQPFKGGGRVAKELAENRAQSTVNNPSEQDDFYQDGITMPLAAFTPERLAMYKDVPTFREKGNDMVYFMQRSIVGPPGLKPEVAEFYSRLFRAVYESKEWQDYMNRNSLKGEFATGEPLVEYWKVGQEAHRKILARTGKIN